MKGALALFSFVYIRNFGIISRSFSDYRRSIEAEGNRFEKKMKWPKLIRSDNWAS
jgi:hypothetical protein